jgi:hypothetical protein
MGLNILPFLLVSACADYDLSNAKGEADDGSEPADADTGGTTDSDPDSGMDDIVPDGWIVRADLAIVAGEPTPQDAVVLIDMVDSVEGGIACTVALDTSGMTAGVSPDADVWAWWTLDVVALDEPCAELPEAIGLGVGELLGDVRAGLGAHGYDQVAGSLYGAYLGADDGSLYVFGYAGTDADLAGDDDAATEAPLPDGLYHLAPLYVFALPE